MALVRTAVSEELSALEAIEIELNPYTISREGGFVLSKSWKHLIGSLKLSGYDPRPLGDAGPHS
jgi:hypothetical protein